MKQENYNPPYPKEGGLSGIPVRTATICNQQLEAIKIGKRKTKLTPNQIGEKYWYIPLNNPMVFGDGGLAFNADCGEAHIAYLKMLKGGALPAEIAVFLSLYPKAMAEEVRWEEEMAAQEWAKSKGLSLESLTYNISSYVYSPYIGYAKNAGVFDFWRCPNLDALLSALKGEKVKMLGKYYSTGVTDADYYDIGGVPA